METKNGKSCLVCRRRKVRCDRSKPICLVCVKHGSNMECHYESQKREVKFVSMKTLDVPTSRVKKPKSLKYPGALTGGTTVVKELDLLKQRIMSLESMLSERDAVTDRNVIQSSQQGKNGRNGNLGDNSNELEDLSMYEDFNFYQDLETVDVKAGRLSFIGALNYISISKVDPYLMTITTMVRKARYDRSNRYIKHLPNRKYSSLEFVPALAREVYLGKFNETDSTANLMAVMYKDDCQPGSNAEKSDGEETEIENNDAEDIIENVENPVSEIDAGSQAQNEKFVQKFLEDESLHGILPEGKKSNKPYLADIINTSAIIKSMEGTPNSNASPQLSSNGKRSPEQAGCERGISQQNIESHQSLPHARTNGIPLAIEDESEALKYLTMLLPSEKLIWKHMDNYFSSPLHALYPFTTEDWFKDMLAGLFVGGRTDSDDPPTFKIEGKLDFVKIATLFVIMRLSYLMYPSDMDHCATEDEKFVVAHEIGTVYIDMAYLCMRMFSVLKRGVLPILHCLILLRVYRSYAPEEGDIADSADSSTFTGSLVQIAQSLGINTDAETSYQLTNFEIYLHSWRNTWYVIYFMDMSEAMNMGNCFSIDVDQFNTKLPHIKIEEDGSIPDFFLNPQLEIASVSCVRKNFELSLHVRKLLKVVMNKRERAPCDTILDLIGTVEAFLKTNYSEDLSSMLCPAVEDPQDQIEKCNNFRMYVSTQSMLLMIQLRLFLHLDNNNSALRVDNFEKPFNLLKKCLLLYADLEPLLLLLYFSDQYDNNNISYIEKIFGPKSKLIILQSCNHIFVRCQTVLHILLSRLIHLYFGHLKNAAPSKESSDKPFRSKELVCKIIKTTLDKLDFANSITESLSGKQFQAWRLSKGNRFLYSIFREKNNNILDPNSPTNKAFQKLGLHRDNLGIPILADNLNPSKKLPKYNNFSLLNFSQFEEIHSIMNSCEWSVFSGIFDEEKLKEAINFRRTENKHNIVKNKKRKIHRPVSKSKSFSSVTDSTDSTSPSSKYSDDKDSNQVEIPQLKVNEVDTHWFNAILKNNNTHSSWNRDDVDSSTLPAGTMTTQSPLVIEADGAPSDITKALSVGLDEMFLNGSFQQESLLQQLQTLSEKQNSSTNMTFSTPHQNFNGPSKGAQLSNDHSKIQPKPNFNSIIDSVDLDYLLFNGDI